MPKSKTGYVEATSNNSNGFERLPDGRMSVDLLAYDKVNPYWLHQPDEWDIRRKRIVAKHRNRWLAKQARDFNPYHAPAGSSEGGQFTSGGSGGGSPAQHLFEETDEGETFDDVLSSLSAEERSEIEKAQDEMGRMVPTDATVEKGGFKLPDGSWTPERQELHRNIIRKILSPEAIQRATPKPGAKPVVIFTGGRPGAGKSSSFEAFHGTKDAIFINSDDIQPELPGHSPRHAGIYHEEASHIAAMVEGFARKHGLNVVYDATMKTSSSAHERVQAYKQAGYDIDAVFTHTRPAVAALRAVKRFSKGGTFTGRLVPPSLAYNSRTNEKTFDSLIPQFRRWELYDNNGSAPKLIARGGKRDG